MTRWITLTAVLILAVAGCGKDSDDAPRAPAVSALAPAADGGTMQVEPQDSASIAPGAITFTWHPVPRAASYRFELLTEAGAQAMPPQETFDTSITVPILEGGAYRWLVVGVLPDGKEAPSPPRSLRITPP